MISGTDISIYQTNSQNPTRFFDPLIARKKGMKFTFIRASNGVAKDNAVDTFARTFADANFPHGFYHFLRHEVSYSTQADNFVNIVKDFDFDLPVVADVEDMGLGLEFIKSWCGRVSSKLSKDVIIYSSPSFWNGLQNVKQATWALEYKYWVAHYLNVSYPQYVIPETIPFGYPQALEPWASNGKKWTFWQWCAKGDGEFFGGNYSHNENVALDMDVYNGSEAEFLAEFDIGDVTPDPDPEPDTSLNARLTKLEEWARGIGYDG
jgi:GH25 family lysozyme M1 (1,4-beta-N-acetylmuramidase)